MSNPPVSSPETCPAELPNWCARRHWGIFWILILCSVSLVAGRIANVGGNGRSGESPFHSANDRSRWATVRSLSEQGTFVIDEVIQDSGPIAWDSIDKVRHVGSDGQFHFYSSKPPLFPLVLAGVSKVVEQATGWTWETDTLALTRTILLIVNGLGWLLFLVFLALAINAVPVRDWTRYFVLACGAFGTFLSTFSVTLNNHLPGAICVMAAIYWAAEIYRRPGRDWRYYAGCGLASGLAVTFELPALALLACLGLLCGWRDWRRTLMAFLPPVLLVAAAFIYANQLAHETWRPAYAHRGDGPVVVVLSGDFADDLNRGVIPGPLWESMQAELPMAAADVEPGGWPGTPADVQRWVVRETAGTGQFAIVRSAESDDYEIRRWGNWYDYPGSYGLQHNEDSKSEVDRGQPSWEVYSFHVFFGHHGIFSLTPIWVLGLAGLLALAGGTRLGGRYSMRWFGLLGLLVSFVVIVFYLRRPVMDRNYGGVTSGLRWVFWLAPIWLMGMLPVVDWLAHTRWGRLVCYGLLVASVLSASYAVQNPWVHPWLYEVWDSTGIPK